jgi:hypothetical protein
MSDTTVTRKLTITLSEGEKQVQATADLEQYLNADTLNGVNPLDLVIKEMMGELDNK